MKEFEQDEGINCPVCSESFTDEEQCEHLVLSSDDSETIDSCVQFAKAESEWKELRSKAPASNVVTRLNSFLSTFIEPCEAVADVYLQPWYGGFPGLSGVWTFVWSSNHEQLRSQIRQRILSKLTRLQKPQSAHLDAAVVEAFAKRIVKHTIEDGGGVFLIGDEEGETSDTNLDVEMEALFAKQPNESEIRLREYLHTVASTALTVCGDLHPLCVAALMTLKDFCLGKKGYRDLARAKQSLAGRANAAGIVGLNRNCTNAAATLAVVHACDLDLFEAETQTLKYSQKTIEFRLHNLHKNGGSTDLGPIEVSDQSINNTFFTGLDGQFISRVGQTWQMTAGIAIISAWNSNYHATERVKNEEQNARLEKVLRKMKRPFDKILAWWPSGKNYEVAFAIKALTIQEASAISSQFEQAAFFFAKSGQPIEIIPSTMNPPTLNY